MKHQTFPSNLAEVPLKFQPVIEHSLDQLMQQGVRNFTVEKICSDLRISKKTIYKYFPSREKFIEALLLFKFDQLFSAVDDIEENPAEPLQYIVRVLQEILNQVGMNAPQFIMDVKMYYSRVWSEIESFRETVIGRFKQCVIRGRDLGLVRKDLDIDFALDMLLKIVQYVFQPETFMHSSYSIGTMIMKFADIFMNGIMDTGQNFDTSFLGKE